MPPKAPGRGAPASRRPAGGSSRDDEQAATTTENGTAGSHPRPPIQRLQSLNRRAPGGSIGPRGAGLGQQPKPALKFQPRASARRAKEERDALQELEAERNRQRLSEAAAIQRARLGRAARGRGTFRGRGGVHGGGPVGFGAGTKRRIDITRSASRHSTSGYNTPAAGGLSSFGDYSSDEDSAVNRLDIEHINLNDDYGSDEEEEKKKDRKGKKPARASRSGLQPIRVERHQHEERVVAVNTEASSALSAGLRQQAQEDEDEDEDNELFITEEKSEQGESRVKSEPTDGDVSMADVPHADAENDETPLPPQTVTARKQVAAAKERAVKQKEKEPDPQSLLQTKEEKEEFARHADDLETLKEILTPSEKVAVAKTAETTEGTETENADGGAEAKEATKEEEEEHDKNAGRLFLIQFPPLTPNLVVPGIGEHAVVDLEDESTETATAGAGESTGLGLGDAEVKREFDEDDEDKARVTSEPPAKLLTATQRRIPAGRVGKLHLHQSGRVTLDWGGISFEIDKGASVNFVQEALVASTDDDGEERSVWAMGQLSEKFIASPEWDKLL
jgi:DNA-directed RNA polymerase III subunit RPC4